jgi:hypothetical protein
VVGDSDVGGCETGDSEDVANADTEMGLYSSSHWSYLRSTLQIGLPSLTRV